jgi:hypothetical protein
MATTLQLTATPRNAQGNVLTGRSISWQSQNTAIATVDGSGLVTSVAPGSTVVTATCGGVSSNVNIVVNPKALEQFGIAPNVGVVNLQQGQSVTVSCNLVRSSGFTSTVNITAGTIGASGVSMLFGTSAGSVASTSLTLTNGDSNTFYVKLTATGGASVGSFAIGINGSGNGLLANTFLNTVVSSSAVPSVSISSTTTAISCARGSTVTIPLTLVRNGGYTGDVNLGTPFGIPPTIDSSSGIPIIYWPSYSWSDSVLTGAENSSVLSVTIPSNMYPGSHQLFLAASGSGIANAASNAINFTIT